MKIKLNNKRLSTYTLNDNVMIKLEELKQQLGVSKTHIIELLVEYATEGKVKKAILKKVRSKFKPSNEENITPIPKIKVIAHAKKGKK